MPNAPSIEAASQALAAAQAREEAKLLVERSKTPDAQSERYPLDMPTTEFDPSPGEQQAFVDQWRAEHPGAVPGRDAFGNSIDPAADALFAWPNQTATSRWQQQARTMLAWSCAVCGTPASETLDLGERAFVTCPRCRPVLREVYLEAVSAELVGDLSRRQRAEQLLERMNDE
jgi:hypothetical protein